MRWGEPPARLTGHVLLCPRRAGLEDSPCVSIHDISGRRLARLGGERPGEGPGQFTGPHGLAVDWRGDLYVGRVSWSAYGSRLNPPRTARSFRKLVRVR